jgi:lysophospholipid acyltransferase (LPLAT)-like uncharacterized protein
MRPFKKLSKTLVHSKFVQGFLVRLVWLYIRFVYATSPWQFIGKSHIQEVLEQKNPLIICFWHGRMAMHPLVWQWKKPFSMLLSQHRDGSFIRDVLGCFGIQSIEGSTSRGGARAAVQIIRALKQGVTVGMTPDGPRGPCEKVSPGIAYLAKVSGACVVAISFSQTRVKRLNTWDKFCLPVPFSKGIFYASPALQVKPSDDEHEVMQKIETMLLDAGIAVDNHV